MSAANDGLLRALARRNALALGVAVGVLAAAGVWLATVVLVVRGGPDTGAHLGLLSQYLPGYSVDLGGAFVGAGWGFVLGFLFTVPAACIYFLGALRQARGVLRAPERTAELGERTGRLDTPSFGLAAGVLAAVGILLATLLLVLKHDPGEPLGPNLGLLGQFLPGYSVSLPGAFLGAGYAFLVAGGAALLVASVYNRALTRR